MHDQFSVKNALLASISPATFDFLRGHLCPITLPSRIILVAPDELISEVYFLESGIATVAATADGERTLEIGQIGWDGVSGIHTLHGIPTTPNCTYMQMAGTGLRLPLAIFQEALAQDPALRRDLSYYGHYCELVVTHSALAGSLYVVQQRLARLLLMWHDRLGDENIRVTHEEISDLLGVRCGFRREAGRHSDQYPATVPI